jgi:hypothetical protein
METKKYLIGKQGRYIISDTIEPNAVEVIESTEKYLIYKTPGPIYELVKGTDKISRRTMPAFNVDVVSTEKLTVYLVKDNVFYNSSSLKNFKIPGFWESKHNWVNEGFYDLKLFSPKGIVLEKGFTLKPGDLLKEIGNGNTTTFALVNGLDDDDDYYDDDDEDDDEDDDDEDDEFNHNRKEPIAFDYHYLFKDYCCDDIKTRDDMLLIYPVDEMKKAGFSKEFIKKWVYLINKEAEKEVVTLTVINKVKILKGYKEVYGFNLKEDTNASYLILMILRNLWFAPYQGIPKRTISLMNKDKNLSFFKALITATEEYITDDYDMSYMSYNRNIKEVKCDSLTELMCRFAKRYKSTWVSNYDELIYI